VTDFAQPILDAIASCPPSFQDDFGLGSAGWSGRRISYLDGELVLTDGNANRAQMDYADFVVEFDARFLPDTNKNYRSNWAISFRNYDVSNYYFGVYFDGSVRLGNLVGDHLDFPYAANPGLETNHLMMIAKGSQFAFYINNKPFYYVENPSIWRWQGDILLGDGTEGPDLGAIVAFDNFKIWNIYGLP
jgi:hypothetical protein